MQKPAGIVRSAVRRIPDERLVPFAREVRHSISRLLADGLHRYPVSRNPDARREVEDALEGVPSVETDKVANSYAEARAVLVPQVGRIFHNKETGIDATLSKNSINKLLSGKAVAKSVGVKEHLSAVANVTTLFENGHLVATDDGSRKGVQLARRFVSLFTYGGEKLVAKTTVLEYERGDQRIYSVEAMEVEKAGSVLAPRGSVNQAESPALPLTTDIVPQTGESSQGGEPRHSVTQGRGDAPDPQREYDEVVARFTNEDGTRKPGWMKAPNGEPTNLTERQWVQVRTPAFKRWFGDWEGDPANASKVVDANGEPLVVYHGTNYKFSAFTTARRGRHDSGWFGSGHYFFAPLDGDVETAMEAAREYGIWVVEAFVNARNPNRADKMDVFTTTREESDAYTADVQSRGFDATIVENDDVYEVVVFSPEQIKSATENVGAFDAFNTDIRYSVTRVPQEGVGRNDAVASINLLKGRTFTNRETGIEARLSSTGAGKLISNKAVAKSVANGFTPAQHNALAAQIDRLYEGAILVEERPDRGGDVNIRSIRRFLHPVRIGEAEAGAYITVKESIEHGNRIYSVEGIRIAALPPTVRRAIADHNSADSAAYADTIAYLGPSAQVPDADGFVRDAVMGMLAAAGDGKGAANAGGESCGQWADKKTRPRGGGLPLSDSARACRPFG